MKITFNKLNKKPIPRPIPWYKKLFKSQSGLALGETRTRKQTALFGQEQEHTLGETKVEDGKTYTLEEGTPSKPRWHRKDKDDDKKPDKIGDKLSDAINKKLAKEEKPGGPGKEPEYGVPDDIIMGDMELMVDQGATSVEAIADRLDQPLERIRRLADSMPDLFKEVKPETSEDIPEDLEEQLKHEPEEPEELFDKEKKEKATQREYTDVGEKIGGARKDLWVQKLKDGQLLRYSDFDFEDIDMHRDDANKVIKKDNFIPKQDKFIEELQNRGYDSPATFLLTKLVGSVAAKPKQNPTEQKRYIMGVDILDKTILRCKTLEDVTDGLNELREMYRGFSYPADVREKIAEYNVEMRGLNKRRLEKRREYSRIKTKLIEEEGGEPMRVQMQTRAVREFRSGMMDRDKYNELAETFKFPKLPEGSDKPIYDDTELGRVLADMEKLEGEFDNLNNQIMKLKAQYYDDNDNDPFSNKNVFESLGTRFIGSIYPTGGRGQLNAFEKASSQARSMKRDDWSWTEDITKRGGEKSITRIPEWKRIVPNEAEREGADPIKDTFKPDDLVEVYGIRGVEYGNWVDEESAKYHTQLAGLALHDLATVLGINPEKISYNGRLALAFGARGKGRASAHYESHRQVINITKFKGGGSLAHEWGHFIDNVVSVLSHGKLTKDNVWLSKGDVGPEIPDNVKTAFNDVMQAMKQGGERFKADVIPQEKSKFRPSREIVKKLEEKSPQEVYDEYALESKAGGATTYNKKLAQAIADYAKEKVTVTDFTKSTSNYVASSRQLGEYMYRDNELFARAFEAYVNDKLRERKMRNTYLVSGNDEKMAALYGYLARDEKTGMYEQTEKKQSEGDISLFPYPTGEERKRINRAIESFVEALKEDDMFEKAMSTFNLGWSNYER